MANDIYIRHQVRLENLKEGEARKIVDFLDDVHQDLLIKLESSKLSDWNRQRYTAMLKTYGDALDAAYTKGIMPTLNQDGLEFTAKNMVFHTNALADQTAAGVIVAANVAPPVVYAAAIAEPMQGKLMVEWAAQLNRKDKVQVASLLRQSWIEGESIGDAAKLLRPALMQSNRDLAAITRTFFSHLSSESRDSVWKANDNIVEGQVWDSILDNRTTINICAPRDQKKYTMKGEPIGHDLPWMGGPGRAHWQCRSMSFPSIKGVKPQIERPAISAGKNYERGDATTRTGKVRKNSAHSRKKGIYAPQTVRSNTTYNDWLKRQPKAFQEDVLGVQKAKAFRSGDWKLGEKFKPQNPTTIENF